MKDQIVITDAMRKDLIKEIQEDIQKALVKLSHIAEAKFEDSEYKMFQVGTRPEGYDGDSYFDEGPWVETSAELKLQAMKSLLLHIVKTDDVSYMLEKYHTSTCY